MHIQAGGGLKPLETFVSFRQLQPPRPTAKMKLICFPGLGGTGAQFKRWPASFPDVEIWTFSWLKTLTNYHALLSGLADEIYPLLVNCHFALFGYSLGGIPAFGLANVLRSLFALEPTALFLAASVAPSIPTDLQEQVRARLKEALLGSLGSSAFETLYGERESLWQSHYVACEALPPFQCPLTAIGGRQDSLIPALALEAWGKHTNGPFSLEMCEGDHAFPFTHTAFLLAKMNDQFLALKEEGQ